MAPEIFTGARRIRARAVAVGERIDTRSLERGRALALSPLTVPVGERGCAVLFRYGAAVCFELEPLEEARFLDALRPCVQGAFASPESEEVLLAIDPEQEGRVAADGSLAIRDTELARLQIVAQILGKSVLMAQHELRVKEAFEQVEPLAEALQQGRGGRVRGRALLRQIGAVLLTQARTVGRIEIAEKPELTWERPELERLYARLGEEYELRDRDVALGRKLEVISNTAETLLDLQNNRRSLRVEWYIVILILVEIVLTLYELFGHV
jgi:uncharacterized Rmd1/YagE family protein